MYALALPALLYLATFGSSIAWLVVSSTPGAVYSTHAVQVTGIYYWSFSAAMNVCASCLISARFWMYRQTIIRAIGSDQGTFYLGYMAMTLESALLYTTFVIIALAAFLANSPLENVFFPVLGTVQVCVPFPFQLVAPTASTDVSFGDTGDCAGVDHLSHRPWDLDRDGRAGDRCDGKSAILRVGPTTTYHAVGPPRLFRYLGHHARFRG